MIITLANLKCWPSVNERRNILVGVTHPLERCGQDTGRAKTRQTPPRKIAATDNRGPKTASYAPTEKGVRWSSAFPINSQRLPMASRALFHHFSVEIALSEKDSLLAHLCRWNPPHAINSYSWTANVLASSSDSQDVAKSASASPAARGAEARWRCACTLTVLMAKMDEQISPKHTTVSQYLQTP
ncbi:hypothetical protein T08_14292 [Trichinella sp. T8]|nr:hypothetical protein T08_14292 [Trichinella sp. T8]